MCLFVSCGSSFSEKDSVFFITSAQHAQPTGSESSDLAIWQSDRESVRREEKKIITTSGDSVGASGFESTTS